MYRNISGAFMWKSKVLHVKWYKDSRKKQIMVFRPFTGEFYINIIHSVLYYDNESPINANNSITKSI
jgi:hypothetical protein